MKTVLTLLIVLLLIAAIAFFVFGHYMIAFGIGFVLIILFISTNAWLTMDHYDYLREKGQAKKKKRQRDLLDRD